MRKGYKSKLDKCESSLRETDRALAEAQQRNKQLEEAEKRRKEELKKCYKAVVYCGHCQRVRSVLIPPGIKLENGDCTYCRVIGYLKQVIDDERKF